MTKEPVLKVLKYKIRLKGKTEEQKQLIKHSARSKHLHLNNHINVNWPKYSVVGRILKIFPQDICPWLVN